MNNFFTNHITLILNGGMAKHGIRVTAKKISRKPNFFLSNGIVITISFCFIVANQRF